MTHICQHLKTLFYSPLDRCHKSEAAPQHRIRDGRWVKQGYEEDDNNVGGSRFNSMQMTPVRVPEDRSGHGSSRSKEDRKGD